MRIIVSVFSNLYTDQRVEKVSRTLHENGYAVELIGNSWGGLPVLDRPYPVTRLQIHSKILKTAYPEFNFKLYRELKKRVGKDTLLLANDLDALLPNYLISEKYKLPLIYDSHELYTEMPALQGRFTQKIWRRLEQRTVPNLKYMMTASESYAQWFVKRYNIKKPVVVQNFPRRRGAAEWPAQNDPKVIMYQGVINPSRGLDRIITAMKHINARLIIAGAGPKLAEYQKLAAKLDLNDKVTFLGAIPPEELKTITAAADVGLSIEENNGDSYFYSLPNKISDYLQARVPVVVSSFPEMAKIVQHYQVGEVIQNHSEQELCEKISKVLTKGRMFYAQNLEYASAQLCWEREEPKILALVKQVERENF